MLKGIMQEFQQSQLTRDLVSLTNVRGMPLFPMEEDMQCMISNSEVSYSNSSTHQFPASKRGRCGGSTSKFKVVVPQQKWSLGAQIYANHQKIWLGTFKAVKEAPMAYDSAAVKLRS
ncbi:putative AP2/ERF and B3 domain-containing protein Os01g0140700 [Tripterygium wilfordii]|uniref:putative AP2/ERF and B3 domain-containing protein Os01g0140700 n=1 Tax=Tripterygium wilfordii TaxID=458696 RepID=UPI0018F825EF|nr:putative AP2/ERF and B3 domain-containing protein Os01g0140700 [Tripterygium wilfordii]XP_038695850.1 putative AP2/ERF and B3 domain-containing protein Os01g0140700 [Tripterygium wilfordii]